MGATQTYFLGRVWSQRPEPRPLGTCVFIAKDEVLTAAHVVAGVDVGDLEVRWVDSKGTSVDSIVHAFGDQIPVREDEIPLREDCAVLKLRMAPVNAQPIETHTGSLAQGEELRFFGYPNASPSADHDEVQCRLGQMAEDLYALDEGSVVGHSGGPALVESTRGPRLAGIVIYRDSRGRPKAGVLPLGRIRALLAGKGTSLDVVSVTAPDVSRETLEVDLAADAPLRIEARRRLIDLLEAAPAASTRVALAGAISLASDVSAPQVVDAYLDAGSAAVPYLVTAGRKLSEALGRFRAWVCALMPELAVKVVRKALVDADPDNGARFIEIPELSLSMSECLVAGLVGRAASLERRQGRLDTNNRVPLKVSALDPRTHADAIARGEAERLVLDSIFPHMNDPDFRDKVASDGPRTELEYAWVRRWLQYDCDERDEARRPRRYLLLERTDGLSSGFAKSLRSGLSREISMDVVRHTDLPNELFELESGLMGPLKKFFHEEKT